MTSFKTLLDQLAAEHDALQSQLNEALCQIDELKSQMPEQNASLRSVEQSVPQAPPNTCTSRHEAPSGDHLLKKKPASVKSIPQRVNSNDTWANQQDVQLQRDVRLRPDYNIVDEELRFMRPKTFDLEEAMQELGQTQRKQMLRFSKQPSIIGARQCILHPHSMKRLMWDLAGLGLVAWDIVLTPLAFLMIEGPWMKASGWIINCFWIVDILLNFSTGFYNGSGLVTDRKKIAFEYASQWLLFDIFVVAPDWVILLMNGSANFRPRWFKAIRMIRLIRTLKLRRLSGEIFVRIQSELFFTFCRAWLVMFVILACMHIIACTWCAVGDVEGGWIELLGLKSASPEARYFVAAHWAFSSLQGTSWPVESLTLWEHVYSVCILPVCLLFMALTVACTVQIASETSYKLNESMRRSLALHAFAVRHPLPDNVYRNVKHFLWDEATRREAYTRETVFLDSLPLALKQDLLLQAYSGSLSNHPLIEFLLSRYPSFVRHLCSEATTEICLPGVCAFAYGDACQSMRFVMTGELVYLHHRYMEPASLASGEDMSSIRTGTPMSERYSDGALQRRQDLVPGSFVSEAVLWTLWEHCGDLYGVEASNFVLVSTSAFADVIRQHPAAHWMSVMYARQFIIKMNKRVMSDVFQPPDVSKWEPDAIDVAPAGGVSLPFKEMLPPHISCGVVEACLTLAQDVAKHGLDENRPHHGFAIIVGNAKSLEKCGRAGFNPFQGHNLCILNPGVADLMRRNAFHTDGAILVDGADGKVIASGWFVADISLGGSSGGARSRSAKAVAQQANGCYVIKCSEDSRGKLILHLRDHTLAFNSTIERTVEVAAI